MTGRSKPRGAATDDVASSDGSRSEPVVLEEILPYLVNRLSFRMNRLLDRDLRGHGLTIVHWRVLAVLSSATRVTVNELAAYAMIEQSTLSRLVMRMEADGLVRRQRSESDGRVVAVSMTGHGRETYDKLRAISMAHAKRITTGFTDAEQARLKQAIRAMIDNLDSHPVAADGTETGE